MYVIINKCPCESFTRLDLILERRKLVVCVIINMRSFESFMCLDHSQKQSLSIAEFAPLRICTF